MIQSIYDSHYDGADAVAGYVRTWKGLKGKIDDERYQAVLDQLTYQAGQAIVWRDAVTMWFFKASGIADSRVRVGTYPGRIEAESARLEGYAVKDVTPWEAASGGKAVECSAQSCSATFIYNGAAGWRDLVVQYFDTNAGASHFRRASRSTGRRGVDRWRPRANEEGGRLLVDAPSHHQCGARPGDQIAIDGAPDGAERRRSTTSRSTSGSSRLRADATRAAARARSARPARARGSPGLATIDEERRRRFDPEP